MAYQYTQELIDSAFTYSDYRKQINETLALPPADAVAKNAAAPVQQFSADG
jgi:hypothetical protein